MIIEPGGYTLDASGRHDVYSMVIRGFNYAPFAFGYVLAVFLVSFHLSHAISSVFLTLGFNSREAYAKIQRGAHALSAILFVGYASIPLSVQLGVLTLP